jgi:WD40 repeat protein
VCAVGDKTARVLDAGTGTVTRVYRGHQGFVNCAQWALDGIRVASASADKTVHIWNATTGVLQMKYSGHTQSVLYLAWSHDGTMIASGSRDTMVHVWDAFSGKLIRPHWKYMEYQVGSW